MKTITKDREVVVHGRLSLSTFNKEVNGIKVEVTKPVIKLTSCHLCGRKPSSEHQTEASSVTSTTKKSRLSAVKN